MMAVADDSLVCNFKKCRKRLNTFAWATSCSHVFCDEDGTREFNKTCKCPACDTELPGKYDIVRVDLQPSEDYKSMVLAGQRPETIMEIASRALSFWTYQAHQERTYHKYCSTKAKERLQQLETYYEQSQAHIQAELMSVKSQLETVNKDLEVTKIKYNQSSEKLMEKSRQYQKLQGMYDALRRRNVTMSSFEDTPSLSVIPNFIQSKLCYQGNAVNFKDQSKQQQSTASSSSSSNNVSVPTTTACTSNTNANKQVDPVLAAAVNVEAMRQSNLRGDQFMIELSTNPTAHNI